MKERILQLRREGKSYRDIVAILGCSSSTVAYHCGDGQKRKFLDRNLKNKKSVRDALKKEFGGKCFRCGYDKSMRSLHFHHLDGVLKEESVARLISGGFTSKAKQETKKCVLVCANCHGELHDELEK